ncbi:MAG: DUF4173 domain-containing protein [bacterium]|nr:DUF4173 domain-containing protein [bacterium]
MNFISQNKVRFTRLLYVALAFFVAILSDLIFWDKPKGLGAFLVVAVYVVGFTMLAHYTKNIKNKWAMLLLVPVMILAFDQMLYNNDLVKMLPFFIFLLAIAYSILLTVRNENKFVFYIKNIPMIRNLGVVFKNLISVSGDLLSWTKGTEHNEKYKQIAIGLAVSVPIIFIFTLLFAGADKVFGDALEKMISFKIDINFETIGRLVRIVVYGFLVGAFFYTLIGESHSLLDGQRKVRRISFTVARVVLSLVNILFAIFVFIQIKYLFGSHDFVIKQGIVFAEYARNGFFQLAWVMALAGLLIAVFYRSSWYHGKNIFVSILKLILIAQIFVIAVSALKRMNLYQNEYGYTTLRLYVEWFIYFASIMFALLAAAIFKHYSFKKVFYIGLVCGVTAFTIVASINVDGVIAKKNVQRYLVQNKSLDLPYLLNTLSTDAIPEIIIFKQNDFTSDRVGIHYYPADQFPTMPNEYFRNLYGNKWFKDELQRKKSEIITEREPWYTFNISAQRALNSLSK